MCLHGHGKPHEMSMCDWAPPVFPMETQGNTSYDFRRETWKDPLNMFLMVAQWNISLKETDYASENVSLQSILETLFLFPLCISKKDFICNF